MPAKAIMLQFEAFLVRQGLVTPLAVIKAMDRQRELSQPIGKIALTQRMLSMRQVFEILDHQADRPLKFGELAIELGHLTQAQVDLLLKIQREARRDIGSLLVEMGAVADSVMVKAVAQYQALGESPPVDRQVPSASGTPAETASPKERRRGDRKARPAGGARKRPVSRKG